MKFLRLIVVLCVAAVSMSCDRGVWNRDGKKPKYTIIKAEAPSDNLLIFECSPDVYGVDPATHSVKMHVRMENMVMGGATKLPNGGIAFTCHRRGSNNAWGASLFVTDKNYKITGEYPICDSPMAPRLIGNTLLIGSSAIEEGMMHKLNVYDATTFKLKKEFLFENMVDAGEISESEGKAYFGVCDSRNGASNARSYFVKLDLNSLEVQKYSENIDFLNGLAALSGWMEGDLAYITNGIKKGVAVLNMSSGKYDVLMNLEEEPEIRDKNMRFLFDPIKIGTEFYSVLHDYDEESGYFAYLIKCSLTHNKVESVKRLNIAPNMSYVTKGTILYDGRLLVKRVDKGVYFIDLATATIEHTVKLDE